MIPTTTIAIHDGNRIVVPDDVSVVTTFVLREQEEWFEDEIHFVRRMLRPGMKCIDIGASYGLYTVALARGVGSSGRVVAFEPTPGTADCLARTLSLNGIGNVELRRMAVSGTSGKRFLLCDSSSEQNHLSDSPLQDGVCIEVDATSIDDLRDSLAAGIDFMKIDAEGEEEAIFWGARGVLQEQSPLVMFELSRVRLHARSIFSTLGAWGYSAYRLLPGLNILVPLSLDLPLPAYQINVFCCKQDRAVRLQAEGMLAMGEGECARGEGTPGAWMEKCTGVPATRSFAGRWIQAAADAGGREKRYLDALDLIVMAENGERAPGVRAAALERAALILSMLCEVAPTVPRLASLARVLSALGEKIRACEAIQKALDLCPDLAYQAGDEPFLLPAPRGEWKEPGMEPGMFLVASLFEQLQRLYCFSTLFAARFYLGIVSDFVIRGLMTPELERRRQLARMFLGLQHGPEPCELLEKFAPDNVNPGYWSGGRESLPLHPGS